MNIILYSTGCPRCKVLKKKLDEKGVQYSIFSNEEEMINIGLEEIPVLSVDGDLLDFTDAVNWINNLVR